MAKISYFFTTRLDGNLAFHVGDNTTDVTNNHKALANKFGYDINKLIHMKQIHSDIVHIVNDNDDFYNPPECDALVTNKKHTPLMVMVADCTPVIFYDDVKEVIAVAHAGREGAFKNIVKKTLLSMASKFHSNIKNIYVKIGANIDVCCYEVGKEIYKSKFDYAFEIRDGKYFLNINKIIKTQLLICGIDKKHIEISDECTHCKNKKYYSYRAKKQTGRFAGVIYLD